MTAFVLDASVAVSWCFPGDPEEDTRYSRHILTLLATHDAVVAEIWAFEITNSISFPSTSAKESRNARSRTTFDA